MIDTAQVLTGSDRGAVPPSWYIGDDAACSHLVHNINMNEERNHRTGEWRGGGGKCTANGDFTAGSDSFRRMLYALGACKPSSMT